MMMAALHRGGLDAVWNPARDNLRREFGDQDFDTNRCGMYELLDRELRQDGFPRMYAGKLIKVLYYILPYVVPGDYRIVYMRRRWEPTCASYERFFKRWPKRQFHSDTAFQAWQDDFVGIARERRDMQVTELWFDRVRDDPIRAFSTLRDMDWPIDCEAAASAIENYAAIPHGAGL
jgi:hypothetical protein